MTFSESHEKGLAVKETCAGSSICCEVFLTHSECSYGSVNTCVLPSGLN